MAKLLETIFLTVTFHENSLIVVSSQEVFVDRTEIISVQNLIRIESSFQYFLNRSETRYLV